MNPKALPKLQRLVILMSLLLCAAVSQGQLATQFSASAISGCSPVVVHFQDASTGNPTKWRWDLGNGVISQSKNPSTTYFNPGTYSVKLVIRNAAGADSLTKTSYITVHANPIVAFSASDTVGCFPLAVQFTNGSDHAAGNTYSWDFGDGALSTLQHPSHIYTAAGNFNVTLKVINATGCSKTFSKKQYIETASGVKAAFTQSATTQCAAPLAVQFNTTSTGTVSDYHWSFGDGAISTSPNPSHTYTASGVYSVRLVTISPQGCRDTISKTNLVNIGVAASFAVATATCVGAPVTFTNTTLPQPQNTTWYFGDGTTSNELSPVKRYATPGTYSVKLVNHFDGCYDSTIRTIVVNAAPAAAFNANRPAGCSVPFTTTFAAIGTSAASYQWFFGDGGAATGAAASHTYNAFGAYTVTLVTTNAGGCTDTLRKADYIMIAKPVVTLQNLPQTGCIPLSVKPSFAVQSSDPVIGYLWEFGDGSISTDAHPTHIYTAAGNFNVRLTITTQSGCTGTVMMPNGVRVGNKPQASFVLHPSNVCASQEVQFTDSSSGNCDQWLWSFGDGDTSALQNPLHQMSGLGNFNVTLVAWSNTCADTVKVMNAVYVRPPLAKFSTVRNCTNKFTRKFTNKSIGDTAWHWDFGDGVTSAESNPVHTYAATGRYIVKLTVTNGDCTHSNRDTLWIIDEKANFTASKNTLCKGETLTLSAQNINADYIDSWRWDFGDGTTSSRKSSVTHTYAKAGTYTVKLRIKDLNGCEDVKATTVTVYGPTALFGLSTTATCLDGNLVRFTDSSRTDGSNRIVNWSWNYGDGTIDSTSTTAFQHSYAAAGSYAVTLSVKDNFGCIDSLVKPAAIIISKPVAGFSSPDTLSCTNKPISFQNHSTGNSLRYQWSFGDGKTATVKNPVHQYAATGSYTITLKVTDHYGCESIITKSHYISISNPKAGFSLSDSVGACPPFLVTFTNASTSYTEMKWHFGDGNTSTLANPSHYYTMPGIYYAKLVVKGPGGCLDSFQKKITVKGPNGSFAYNAQPLCRPAVVALTGTTSNAASILWDLGDGTVQSGLATAITHTYAAAGNYIPKMILTDAAGCRYPVIGTDTIKVIGVDALYTVDRSTLCDSGLVSFGNNTVSNDLITAWQWDFGDGSYSTVKDPSHRYRGAGTYYPKLVVRTAVGCIDTAASLPVTVFNSPIISIAGDTAACMPATLQFGGRVSRGVAANLTWSWDFGNGQMSAQQNPAAQLYVADGAYPVRATVTDNHGCSHTITKPAIVHPLPATNAGADAALCQNATTQLAATGAARYVWQPAASLSCLTCPSPIASPSDTTSYTVIGYTTQGCTKSDTVRVFVRKRFQLLAAASDTVCLGGSTQLWAKGADSYNWIPATGLDNASSASPKAVPATTTSYKVIATDKDHCFTDTATVTVKVYPIPVVSVVADQTMSAGGSVSLTTTNSTDINNWRWSPAATLSCATCPSPKAAPRQTTTYKVQVRNDGGCTASDDVTVSVICNNGNLFIPNTFSPNGDGSNERFYPRGTGIHNIRSFRVFNRWGEVVYERLNFKANDAASGWDGTYRGRKAGADVYIYTCEVVCSNGEVLPFKGDVTLLQ